MKLFRPTREPDFILEEGPCRKQFWFEEMIFSTKVWTMEEFISMNIADGRLGHIKGDEQYTFVDERIVGAFKNWVDTKIVLEDS